MTAKRAATVIIPNYNGMKWLPKCIGALEKQTTKDFEILVVENASTDGSREWLTEHRITYVKEKENRGFAGGVNDGIRASETPYVILLNNDTEVFPEFVEELLRAIRRSKKLFAVSAKMLSAQDPDLMDDAGDSLNLFGFAWQNGTGERAEDFEKGGSVFSACAGAAIYRRDLLMKAGLFDEKHFAYLEDVDLSWRARLMGWDISYCPQAKVLHYGSATSGSRYNAFKVRLAARNSVWMNFKNQHPLQLFLNFPWLAAGVAMKTCFFAAKGLHREYMSGIAEGITQLDSVRQVDFSRVPLRRFLMVEWEMLSGTFRYFEHRRNRVTKVLKITKI